MPALHNPTALSAGAYNTCALDDTGVVCWGDNFYGQTTLPALIIDPDGDGVSSQNGLDACPRDPTGTVDTDRDGICNPTDSDDDNDGAPDVIDVYPLDRRYSSDNDADELPDQWESTNGYDKTKLDALADVDADRLNGIQEFLLGTRGDQKDSDFDRLGDGLEIALARDPTIADYAAKFRRSLYLCDG